METTGATPHVRTNRPAYLEGLGTFLSFPSVSGQTENTAGIIQCAKWLAGHFRSIGLEHASVIPTAGHPVVYAEWRHAPGRPTVLIYGHYDVQPAEPLEQWRFPPFEPVVRGNWIYGRGASDDKGQVFAHVKAMESLLRTRGKLPVNVVVLIEGEEEIGSPNLREFFEQYRHLLAADVAVVSDMQIPAADRPAITYALRGALGVELEVHGPKRDLHSGVLGGAVGNPLQILCKVVAGLHDLNGRIAVRGFYDRVRPVDAEERAYMARVGISDAQILRNTRAAPSGGEAGYSLYERSTIRPTIEVTGIAGGYEGPGVKAVIPAKAVAKLDLRLVPDQRPEEIDALLRDHVARATPAGMSAHLRTLLSARPVTMDRRHPAVRAAASAYKGAFGVDPLFLRNGGTIPVVGLIQDTLGIPVVLMGFGLPDDSIHGPNERLHLPTFFRGIQTSMRFLMQFGQMGNTRSRRSQSSAQEGREAFA